MSMSFADPGSLSAIELEEGSVFAPRFDANGLIPAIAQHARTGRILMMAFMNAEALSRTLATAEVHYYSRSRKSLWKKGETSGDVQKLVGLRVDCDQDCLLLFVEPQGHGAACHTGRAACFYRQAEAAGGAWTLVDTGDEKLFDPAKIYQDYKA